MDMHISIAGNGDRTRRIYRHILTAILDGQLEAGDRLPSSRDLSRQLGVSRNTVAFAYEQLVAEGFAEARIGAGTYVAATPSAPSRQEPSTTASAVYPRAYWQDRKPWARMDDGHCRFSFAVGTPDVGLFPRDIWRRVTMQTHRQSGGLLADYRDPAGTPRLRREIARHFGIARSVHATDGDIIVTHGAQQAFDLVGKVMIDPGDVVAVEDPGYPPARDILAALGATIVGVPVDDEGIVVSSIPVGTRLIVTTPSHQLPLGTAMSIRRRTDLLAFARERNAAIIEDDYDSEFRFGSRSLETLQSLDPDGRVVYVGTFSKTLFPALRIGFLIAPRSLQPALREAKRLSDWHDDPVAQEALATFLEDGHLIRHLQNARRVYARRHEVLVTAINEHLGSLVQLVPSAAGLHLCVIARDGVRFDTAIIQAKAQELDVFLQPLETFSLAVQIPCGLVLGIGRIREEDIDEGVRRIAVCINASRIA